MDNFLKNKTIGVIGFGNFGKVVCSYLFPKNNVLVFSPHATEADLLPHCKLTATVDELVKNSDIIVPSVPIKRFEDVIKQIAAFVRPDQIVMDICSVKQHPITVMQQNLPNTTGIIATHPMFGPNSLEKNGNTLEGLRIVVKNVSANAEIYEEVKRYFFELQLTVIEMEPEEHDKLSAHSQFFSLVTAYMAQQLNLQVTHIDTPGATAIFEAVKYMGQNDEIIKDMLTFNPYAKALLDQMILLLQNLEENK